MKLESLKQEQERILAEEIEKRLTRPPALNFTQTSPSTMVTFPSPVAGHELTTQSTSSTPTPPPTPMPVPIFPCEPMSPLGPTPTTPPIFVSMPVPVSPLRLHLRFRSIPATPTPTQTN